VTSPEKTGKPANKFYSGTFNVRIGQELHRKAAQEAAKRNISLNDYVGAQAVKTDTDQNDVVKVERDPVAGILLKEKETPCQAAISTHQAYEYGGQEIWAIKANHPLSPSRSLLTCTHLQLKDGRCSTEYFDQ
jgi:hypothetical protein